MKGLLYCYDGQSNHLATFRFDMRRHAADLLKEWTDGKIGLDLGRYKKIQFTTRGRTYVYQYKDGDGWYLVSGL